MFFFIFKFVSCFILRLWLGRCFVFILLWLCCLSVMFLLRGLFFLMVILFLVGWLLVLIFILVIGIRLFGVLMWMSLGLRGGCGMLKVGRLMRSIKRECKSGMFVIWVLGLGWGFVWGGIWCWWKCISLWLWFWIGMRLCWWIGRGSGRWWIVGFGGRRGWRLDLGVGFRLYLVDVGFMEGVWYEGDMFVR